jgi:hypothetical protein
MANFQESTPKSFRIGLLAFSIIIAAIAGSFFFMNTLGASAPPEFIEMSETNRITFKAHLNDSEPFGRPYLSRTSDNIPANLLDHIEINRSYSAELSAETFVEFAHSANVTVTARQHRGSLDNDNSPVILDRTFPLCRNNQRQTSLEKCDNSDDEAVGIIAEKYSHTETYQLYLQPYLDFVKSTTESFVDYPIRATINIDFVTTADNEGQLRSSFKRSMTIPLTDENFSIGITGEESRTADYYAPQRDLWDYILLVIAGVAVIIAVVIGVITAKKLLSRKTPYRQEVDKYLHDYDDAIINTSTPPDLSIYKEQTAIEDFKELLNLATVTGNPIMYYEYKEGAFFYCTKEEVVYFFMISKVKKDSGQTLTLLEAEIEEEIFSITVDELTESVEEAKKLNESEESEESEEEVSENKKKKEKKTKESK